MATAPPTGPSASGIGFGFFLKDVPTTLDLVQRIEQAGVDTAWMVMPAQSYDTLTVAAAALARTERVRVGTSIVPAFTRHPLAFAGQTIALEELAPGRLRLGLGSGNLATMADGFGTPIAKPVSQLREHLQVLRSAVTTGKVTFQGTYYDVDTELPTGAATPITVAALGPKMFALAGELADAAMSWLCPIEYLDTVARPAIQGGANSAGRQAPPLITQITAVVESDERVARDIARPLVQGFGANPQYAAMFARAGLALADDGRPSDELVDALIVNGDETTLTDRLGKLAEQEDELLVTLQSADSPHDDETTLLRALGNVSRHLG
jgi:alkanesulfonate monooxygenase SsuD/methylene tetrahydromethanopterin reductase-like flavin-dependent oxidoreductase (luciferase family)